MFHVPKRRGWEIPEREATSESAYLCRREFLKRVGIAGAGVAMGGTLGRGGNAIATDGRELPGSARRRSSIYPARRNSSFALDDPLTDETMAGSHTPFYEFTEQRERVAEIVHGFDARPWRIETAGLVAKPRVIDVDELIRLMPIEERLYRHRCVAGWAMAVPWTGFPLRELVRWASPLSGARYLRVVSFLRPDEAPNQQRATWYPWPYHEAYRIDEATNELAFVAVGVYGHDLASVHGAPLRLALPWKYGYKSAKSVARVEFMGRQPDTFWTSIAPETYGFLANVDPGAPLRGRSQATEIMIGTGERRATLPYNGYGEWVRAMYEKVCDP